RSPTSMTASRRFSKIAGSSPWPTCRATFHAIREGSMSTEIPPRPSESGALQILATEHWSLLATRALTYQESLGRVNMFLTILSGAVIALALVAQAPGADRLGSMCHGLQTLPGMLSWIVAAVGGAIGGLIAAGFGAPAGLVLLSGIAAFVLAAVGMGYWGSHSVRRLSPGLAARFPRPRKPPT